MRLVNIFGEDVPLEDLEPWCHFVEHAGERAPIVSITFATEIPGERRPYVKIEWQPDED